MSSSDVSVAPLTGLLFPSLEIEVRGAMSASGLPLPAVLTFELLHFLALKVKLNDTTSEYLISCPTQVDAAWHELILETNLY